MIDKAVELAGLTHMWFLMISFMQILFVLMAFFNVMWMRNIMKWQKAQDEQILKLLKERANGN